MSEPCVFIGSSSEGLEVARKVRNQLDDVAEVTIWHEGPFGLSQGSLESLVAAAHRSTSRSSCSRVMTCAASITVPVIRQIVATSAGLLT